MKIQQTLLALVAFAVLSASAIAQHNWRNSGPAAGWTQISQATTTGPGQAPYNPTRIQTVTVWRNDTGTPQNVIITLSAFPCTYWSASISDRYFESYPSGAMQITYYFAATYTFTVASGDTVKLEMVEERGQWYDGDSYISDQASELTEMYTTTAIAAVETWTVFDEMTRDWYDAGGWSPDPSTVPNGQGFTQSKNQQQDWRRGERSNLGSERNVSTYTVSRIITQTATGTKQKTAPVVTWSTPSAITYGTRLGAGQLNATANTSGSFSYSPGENTTLNAEADQVLEVTFTPDDAETFTTATAAQTITVKKAPTVLTITSPASPTTLQIDSAAAITTSLRRGSTALSTASVSYAIGTATGTAAGTLTANQFSMTAGAGNDTISVNAAYPGDANHLPSTANVNFRVPMPGSVVFGYPNPVVSPVALPNAYLFAEHGPTTSTFDFQIRNPGELPVDLTEVTVTPGGEVPAFRFLDSTGAPVSLPRTVPAGATVTYKVSFRPLRYQLNSDTIRFSWQCKPSVTVLNNGEVTWLLRGQGLKPIMATMPKGSPGDPGNPRDLQGQWPTLRSQ